MTEIITNEHLYLEDIFHPANTVDRNVYIKYNIIEDYQRINSTQNRKIIWGQWSWSDTNLGPWKPYKYMVYGVYNV